MAKEEHSINEIYDVLQDFFGFVKTQFENTEKRFEGIDKRFEGIDKRFEQIDQRFDSITVDVKDLKKGQSVMEKDIRTIKEDLSGISGAIFELTEKFEDHELRIGKLEAIK